MTGATTITLAGMDVARIGFGAMPLSVDGRPDADTAIAVLHTSLDAGVRLIDTADAYCLDAADTGHNESLIARALQSWGGPADEVLVATKGGHVRTSTGGWEVDGRPEHLRSACEASLRRLGVECVGLYQFHRPDPRVPFEESVGALADLLAAGKVRAVGISNVNVDQIDVAAAMVPLASVQNRFGPDFRSSRDELERCAELGLAFLAWSPLGGRGAAARVGRDHPALADVAIRLGVSPQQVCLAWELSLGPHVIPIPGSRRPGTAVDSAAALHLDLADDLDLDHLMARI